MGKILRRVQAPRVKTTQSLSLGHSGRSIYAEEKLRAHSMVRTDLVRGLVVCVCV